MFRRSVLLGLVVCAAAQAGTATLEPETCTYLNPTSGLCPQSQIAFNSATSTILIGGMTFTGQGFPTSSEYVDSPYYADDGSVVLVSAHFTYHSKAINMGRAHYYRHWWTLDDGSITTP